MTCDALLEADCELRISERATDSEDFLSLNDSLLHQIQYYPCPDKRMLAAQDIIRRMNYGQLYPFIGYALKPKPEP